MQHMNMCPICGNENMRFTNNENHNLAVMGLPRVTVVGIHIYTCSDCGERFKEYPTTKAFKEMIVKSLVALKRNLTGKEMAFIRKTLGFTAKKWSSLIGVHHVTLSDWENEKSKPNKSAEMALRMKASLDLYIEPDNVGVNEGEASVQIAALPTTIPMPRVSNWSQTNKWAVNS